ncbi:MAG: caspase family protein [Kordiimonadaceae bacterium]|nr:caspase family protein [Kordiimonadaceae bacterium]MBO6570275.1 caspase family protein [Kordiimonadaceae bacterium]MBO6965627.1 caspase family protein [Kordiimonadaceae bacterium]
MRLKDELVGQRKAILIGCSEYEDNAFLSPLKYAVNDIEKFGDLLGNPEYCGFSTTVLANPKCKDAASVLYQEIDQAGQDDFLLFYYSGHGKLSKSGALMLAMPETREVDLGVSALSTETIKQWMNDSSAGRKAMILDCCYSGASANEGFKSTLGDQLNVFAKDGGGSFLLTASTAFQTAKEIPSKKASALTSCLIDGISSGNAAPDGAKAITLAQLANFVQDEVPKLNPGQRPQFWAIGSSGEIEIARRRLVLDEAKRAALELHFAGLFHEQEIDGSVHDSVRSALKPDAPELDQETVRLLLDCLDNKIAPGFFVGKWTGLLVKGGEPTQPEEPQRQPDKTPENDNPSDEHQKTETAVAEAPSTSNNQPLSDILRNYALASWIGAALYFWLLVASNASTGSSELLLYGTVSLAGFVFMALGAASLQKNSGDGLQRGQAAILASVMFPASFMLWLSALIFLDFWLNIEQAIVPSMIVSLTFGYWQIGARAGALHRKWKENENA